MRLITFKHGSHLYGLNTAASDLDLKSVYMPNLKELFTGNFKPSLDLGVKHGDKHEKNTKDDIDHTVFSIHEFFRLLTKGEMVAIDLIHATDLHYATDIRICDMFFELRKHRHLFYCKEMKSFMGYVRNQAAKYGIKGSRLAFARELNTLLVANKPAKDAKLIGYKDILPENEYARKLDEGYELFGALYQWTGWFSSVLTKTEKMINEYGHRAKMAEQNEGVDFKALSHALRAAYQLQMIFKLGDIRFPFAGTQHQMLMDVKQGKIPYVEVAALIEEEMSNTESASATSGLPERVDISKVNELLFDIVSKYHK